ncbi:hypothetical protein N7462_003807 [Penicillium macrosclerotiorum]|uniref:uncharacterized protein n=1 Tax=Penicillium macrosclerotiorum TaxID=303699 RepID=UPI002548D149|nr:uncharacterized protein N7462_003807 [Penicillium macrosclerotiorum]KAJ5689415.1 hypothetical protein N7462_003807 [Penicillium macrosclerotiorum]
MPDIPNTPESVLPRSDSRNPATTCRGITAQGRPCRRALASSQTPSPATTPRKKSAHNVQPDMASLYCWQHKDQAASSSMGNQANQAIITPVKPRTSIDTLMDRLGVLEIKDEKQRPPRKAQRHRTSQNRPSEKQRRRPKKTFCCFEIVDEDNNEDGSPSASVPRPVHAQPSQGSTSLPPNAYRPLRPVSAAYPHAKPSSSAQRVSSVTHTPSRPPISNGKHSSSSQTSSLLSWIPSTLSPQTTSILLTELAKPISEADEEGYIYMFWVTPQTTAMGDGTESPLPRDIAVSILPSMPSSSDMLRPPPQPRSVSDALRAAHQLNALTSNPTSSTPGTIRLKIGRTSNVHRRLAEWTRQCSHDLTLIRYYPYTPSSSTSSSPARAPLPVRDAGNRAPLSSLVPGRKVPHVHRVERLIHLELGDLRIRDLGRCSECGKEHREWFEVEAEKEALRRVDECVRRWVSWGESRQ